MIFEGKQYTLGYANTQHIMLVQNEESNIHNLQL